MKADEGASAEGGRDRLVGLHRVAPSYMPRPFRCLPRWRIAPLILKYRRPKLNQAEKRQFDQKFLRGSLEVRSHRSDMRGAGAGPRPGGAPRGGARRAGAAG